MQIKYTTPTNKNISPNHPEQQYADKEFRLANHKLMECIYLPDITYHIESTTGDYVESINNVGEIYKKYPHMQ